MQQRAAAPDVDSMEGQGEDLPEVEETPLRAVRFRSKSEVAALVLSVEGTVRQVTRRYGSGLSRDEVEDLQAAGRVGAVEAALRFDPDRGASFNTYAIFWIRTHVFRQVIYFWGRGRFASSTMSHAARKIFFGQGKARRAIEARGEEATQEAVAGELGIDVELLRAASAAVSDSGVPRDEDGECLYEVVDDSDPSKAVCDRDAFSAAVDAIDDLDDRSRYIVEQRYLVGRTLDEVAVDLGFTREWVRQIEVRALSRLRRRLE